RDGVPDRRKVRRCQQGVPSPAQAASERPERPSERVRLLRDELPEQVNEAQALQREAPLTLPSVLGVSTASQIGQALGNDPTSQQLTQKAQAAFTEATTALQNDAAIYKRIAKLQPGDLNTQYHYAQVADLTGDSKSAIAAYKQVLKLGKNDPGAQQSAQVARQRIAALSAATHG